MQQASFMASSIRWQDVCKLKSFHRGRIISFVSCIICFSIPFVTLVRERKGQNLKSTLSLNREDGSSGCVVPIGPRKACYKLLLSHTSCQSDFCPWGDPDINPRAFGNHWEYHERVKKHLKVYNLIDNKIVMFDSFMLYKTTWASQGWEFILLCGWSGHSQS